MSGVHLITATCIVFSIILITIILFNIQKRRLKRLKRKIIQLDKEKNLIVSAPVMAEMTKVEAVLKNDKLEEKYHEWQRRFFYIKDERIPEINDMIIELDLFKTNKDHKALELRLAKCEIEVYKAREAVDNLLEEIREITLSEEKYRDIITKLKTKFRGFLQEFNLHKFDYEDMEQVVELQLENIEKRFQDFEIAMDNNEYDEVVHIVKALDVMIDHMGLIVSEVPDLVLLSKRLIPKRIEEIENIYKDMKSQGYSLEYLKLEYNIKESKKHLKDILGRMKVLNLEDCMFELKTMFDYFDGIFNDFEKEKLCRKLYEESLDDFKIRLDKLEKMVNDIYLQMDDIISLYHLKSKDIEKVDKIKIRLQKLISDFMDFDITDKEEICYSKKLRELQDFASLLKVIEDDLDNTLKNLGSMYDDELRAREQLDEIENLLNECKIIIRSYKLPIITNHYFIELSEANDAILEIIKELEKKPIVIKTLNTRVDTARDLVLKLYNTTTDMIKKAKLAEEAILYGNRYRSYSDEVKKALTLAEDYFLRGMYQESLDASVEVISEVDLKIHQKLSNIN